MFAFVIPVGGKGTRVSKLTNGKAKAEINISKNIKIIDFQVKKLIKFKKKIIFLSNSKNKSLNTYIKKKYSKNKVSIISEDMPLGTAGCLHSLQQFNLKFYIIIYGDLIFNIDIKKLINFHLNKKSECTLVIHPNNHVKDSDAVQINRNCEVEKLYIKPHKSKNIPNLCLAGINIIDQKLIKFIKKNKFQDFSKNFLKTSFHKINLYGYNTREYIKDAGTIKRIRQIGHEIKSIKFKKGNFKQKIPALFLDKDGVINYLDKKKHYQNPLKILNGVQDALRIINKSGYLCIIITNQPAISKGIISEKKFLKDMNLLSYNLSNHGVYYDRLYFCPHHPDKGYKNEIKNLKIKCGCRKPRNGLFKKAIKELNVDVKKSFVIGDQISDYIASKNTKLKFIGVNNKTLFKNNKILNKENLLSATRYIFR